MTAATVTSFRLAIARARRPQDRAKRRADATRATLHEGQSASWVMVSPRRPVRLQAAQDIATTRPGFVAGSFRVLG
ncbi:MAG: hypothetical protein WCO99_13230 [Planctomycetota bacterium]